MPESTSTTESFKSIPSDNDSLSKREKLRSLKDNIKSKARDLLDINPENDSVHAAETASEERAINSLQSTAAFNPAGVLSTTRSEHVSVGHKTINILETGLEHVVHPKTAVKHRAAETTAGKIAKNRPNVSKEADSDLLQKLDELEDLKYARTVKWAQVSEDEGESIAGFHDEKDGNRIDVLESALIEEDEKRLGIRVAWQTHRHLQRVKVIHRGPVQFPDKRFFEERDINGVKKYRWDKWLAYIFLFYSYPFTAQYIDDMDESHYSVVAIRRHLEKLILASEPFQIWMMRIRAIYRWENPVKIGQCMATYFTMWYFSHLGTFVYGCIIYCVLKQRFVPPTLEERKETVQRGVDKIAKAFKIADLMDKHGNDDWLRPLLEELLNISQPGRQLRHIILPLLNIFVLLLTPPAYVLRTFFFIGGIYFFLSCPIASRYPKYRLLVSPIKWVLWNVPTHAEWSVHELRSRSEDILRDLDDSQADPKNTEDDRVLVKDYAPMQTDSRANSRKDNLLLSKILSFHCIYANSPGHIKISETGLSFHPSMPKSNTSFVIPYSQLDEILKCRSSSPMLKVAEKLGMRNDGLELRVLGGESVASIGAGRVEWG